MAAAMESLSSLRLLTSCQRTTICSLPNSRVRIEPGPMCLLLALLQVPPMFSGIKYAGRPLHKYAEKGMVFELQPRPAYVKEFETWRLQPSSPDVHFRLTIAKGGYVRALVRPCPPALQCRMHH